MIFIDDYIKFTWFYPLKRKSDVLETFIAFYHRVERQFSTKLISFQSDWGGEFQAVNHYLKTNGVIHRVSYPHTPEQNGIVECKHRHIIETCLSLLTESHLPKNFWDEGVATATYLINRLPTLVLKNRSPFEVLFKRLPDYKFMKTFGCLCYLNLRPLAQNKLTL